MWAHDISSTRRPWKGFGAATTCPWSAAASRVVAGSAIAEAGVVALMRRSSAWKVGSGAGYYTRKWFVCLLANEIGRQVKAAPVSLERSLACHAERREA